MTRRSTGLSTLVLLLFWVSALSLGSLAAEPPKVLQISDPSYSAADRVAISQALVTLENALNERLPLPSFRLTARGWQQRDFALFAAGRLEAAGFEVLVVQGTDSGDSFSTWLLAGVALDDERTAWIPVNPYSSLDVLGRIGQIPWESAVGGAFAAWSLAPTAVTELPPNRLPSASFIVLGESVQQETTHIHSTSQDGDGSIVAYAWYVGDEQVEVSSLPVLNYVFPAAYTYTVTLRVYDNRGGMASTSKSVEVEEEGGCGCHP